MAYIAMDGGAIPADELMNNPNLITSTLNDLNKTLNKADRYFIVASFATFMSSLAYMYNRGTRKQTKASKAVFSAFLVSIAHIGFVEFRGLLSSIFYSLKMEKHAEFFDYNIIGSFVLYLMLLATVVKSKIDKVKKNIKENNKRRKKARIARKDKKSKNKKSKKKINY